MNDFTKQELHLLFAGIQLWMEEIYPQNEDDRNLRNSLYKKIESMIENYCEHESEPMPQEICCVKCQRTLLR